jgi:hypothetical protein
MYLFRLYTIVILTYIREAALKSCALQIYSNFLIILYTRWQYFRYILYAEFRSRRMRLKQ